MEFILRKAASDYRLLGITDFSPFRPVRTEYLAEGATLKVADRPGAEVPVLR
jgi:hypothetical protein